MFAAIDHPVGHRLPGEFDPYSGQLLLLAVQRQTTSVLMVHDVGHGGRSGQAVPDNRVGHRRRHDGGSLFIPLAIAASVRLALMHGASALRAYLLFFGICAMLLCPPDSCKLAARPFVNYGSPFLAQFDVGHEQLPLEPASSRGIIACLSAQLDVGAILRLRKVENTAKELCEVECSTSTVSDLLKGSDRKKG